MRRSLRSFGIAARETYRAMVLRKLFIASADDVFKSSDYRISPFDAQHLRLGMQKLAQAALAAGAVRVQTLHNTPFSVENAEGLPAFERATKRASIAANRLGVFSAHQMGTARMHRDPQMGVVDADGRVHGHSNLYVTDSSVFPLASGVNPMLTIMALAHRAATLIVQQA